MNRKFLNLFKNEKPILAMLHLKGTSDEVLLDALKKKLQSMLKMVWTAL